MESMGLVFDPNAVLKHQDPTETLGLEPYRTSTKLKKDKLGNKTKSKKNIQGNREVVGQLEAEASKPQPKLFKFGAEISKFIVYCIEKYGDDYEVNKYKCRSSIKVFLIGNVSRFFELLSRFARTNKRKNQEVHEDSSKL